MTIYPETTSRSQSDATRDEHDPVVFVTRAERRHHTGLLRAAALAVVRQTTLRVVLCVPVGRSISSMLFPQDTMESVQRSAGDLRRVRAAEAWVARLTPDAEIEIERGSVATVAARVGREGSPNLLVVSGRDLDRASDAVWLATETGVPVFVARSPAGRTVVLAATDLEDRRLPIASSAWALARGLRVPLVAMHNAPVCIVQPMTPHGAARALGPSPDELRLKGERLAQVAHELEGDTETVLASEPSTARAVLDAARSVSADVIAIGARRRGWLDRLLFGSVAEVVVARSSASVLLTPIGAPAFPHGAS